jgi:hypothetical protein
MISEKMRRKAEDPIVKEIDSDLLSEQIKAFVAAGNTITEVEQGKSAKYNERLSKSNRMAMSQKYL